MKKLRAKVSLVILASLNLLLFVSCCVSIKHINKDLQSYVDSYDELINDTCPKLKENYPNQIFIEFGKLQFPIIGLCSKGVFKFKITIDPDYWKDANSATRLALVYHELGHCVLKLDHSEDKNNYMNENLPSNMFEHQINYQVFNDITKVCLIKNKYEP